ncbi:MAG: hypothetical protein JNL85_09865 [Rubrivivax sp.]|nr:hypothetical protein [Rubrivivax sp.]
MTDHAGLVDEVRALREEVGHLMRRLLAPDDRRDLAALLPLVWAILGTRAWTAADLAAAAAAGAGARADALVAFVATYTTEAGGLRMLGRLLTRCEGASAGGLRLHRLDVTSDGGIYAVRPVPGFPVA